MTATDARTLPFAHVLPVSATLSSEGHLAIGGLDTVALAAEYGTPLYVFDAAMPWRSNSRWKSRNSGSRYWPWGASSTMAT